MKQQEGRGILALILIIVVVVAAFWWLNKSTLKAPAETVENLIQNKTDLDTASKDLDNTDLTQMDSGLNQLGTDSSSF